MSDDQIYLSEKKMSGAALACKFLVISVVLPCLNEEETVGICIKKARKSIEALGYDPEILVVDNGCTDHSIQYAMDAGGRVVVERERGYGNALRKGIDESCGGVILIADADNTYDLSQISLFLKPILDGEAEFVIGNRFKSMQDGAMPFLHRYIGNPVLSFLFRFLFSAFVKDVHCGMRAFTRETYQKLNLVTKGMEYASEMVFRASVLKLRIAEVDIPYHLRLGRSKLRAFRDGWRHLRLMLLYSPDFIFVVPSILLWTLGTGFVLASLFSPVGDGHLVSWMMIGAMGNIIGLTLGAFGLIAKAYGHYSGLRLDRFIQRWSGRVRLEHGLAIGILTTVLGLGFFISLYFFSEGGSDGVGLQKLISGFICLSNASVVFATSFILSLMVIPHKTEQLPYSIPATDRH